MDLFKFIPYPKNGERIIDKYGVLWIFDGGSNTWVNDGYLDVYGEVSDEKDALVNSRLFELLDILDPEKFNGLKLADNTSASFYYLYSSDKTIKFKFFKHLGTEYLSIEADQSVLSRKFKEFMCPGPKGPQGNKGSKGLSGIPAQNEKTTKINHTNGKFVVDKVHVNTPIDTPISFRLFRNSIQIMEVLVSLDNQVSIILDETYELEEGTGDFDIRFEDNELYMLFVLDGQLDGSWAYKVRQRGPKGNDGKDGNWFLEIVEEVVDNEDVLSPQAIYSIYKSGDSIAWIQSSVNDTICASGLIPSDLAFFKFNLDSSILLSAKYMSQNCRDIVNWKYSKPELNVPELDMPQWTPTECCPKTRV